MKSIIVGTELKLPDDSESYLDFPDSPIYFTDVCGTSSYVYCLCEDNEGYEHKSKIDIFAWKGNCKFSYQLNYKLKRIAVSKDDTGFWGLYVTGEGGTDIVRFEMPWFSRLSLLYDYLI